MEDTNRVDREEHALEILILSRGNAEQLCVFIVLGADHIYVLREDIYRANFRQWMNVCGELNDKISTCSKQDQSRAGVEDTRIVGQERLGSRIGDILIDPEIFGRWVDIRDPTLGASDGKGRRTVSGRYARI